MNQQPADIQWRPAWRRDAWGVYRLHKSAAAALDRRYGRGPWSRIPLVATLRRVVLTNIIHVLATPDGALIGACSLTPHKIEYYNDSWFQPSAKPFYLRSMSIRPEVQRCGFGRRLMQQAEQQARTAGADALRLDAYEGPGGAGGFYEKCGYRKVFTGSFSHAVLEVFEKSLN